jgi:hypothetical protein
MKRPDGPRVLLLELSESTSSKGTVYLSGYCGAAKVLGFKSTEVDKYGCPHWELFVAEPETPRHRPVAREDDHA